MKKRVIICSLRPEAAADLAAIDAESNLNAWSEKLFRNEFRNSHSIILGAKLDGSIVGFVVCHLSKPDAHIVQLAISQSLRKQGIGSKLLIGLFERLRKEGAKWASLEVRVSNEAAIYFYESLGFSEIAHKSAYYSNGEDAKFLRANLEESAYLFNQTPERIVGNS